jgi:hypothetical protein
MKANRLPGCCVKAISRVQFYSLTSTSVCLIKKKIYMDVEILRHFASYVPFCSCFFPAEKIVLFFMAD